MSSFNSKTAAFSGSNYWWISKTAPPLFLLIGAFIPPDLSPWIFLHIALVVVFLKSVISIIKTLRIKSVSRFQIFQKLLQPGLAVIIVVLNMTLIAQSSGAARDFAIKAGRMADKICKENMKCPDELAGFICGNGSCRTEAGLTARFPVFYQAGPDKRSFRIGVRFSIDDHLLVTGGVTEQLSASNFYDELEEKIKL